MSEKNIFYVFRIPFCRFGKVVTFGMYADSDAVFGKMTKLEFEFSSLSTPVFYEIGAADSLCLRSKSLSTRQKSKNVVVLN